MWTPLDYPRFRNVLEGFFISELGVSPPTARNYTNRFENTMANQYLYVCEDVQQPAPPVSPPSNPFVSSNKKLVAVGDAEPTPGLLRLTRCSGDYGEDVVFFDPAAINYLLPHGPRIGGKPVGCRLFFGSANDCMNVVETHEEVLRQLAVMRHG